MQLRFSHWPSSRCLVGVSLLSLALLTPCAAFAQVPRPTSVYVFKDSVGCCPSGRLLQAADGSFYGVTSGSGVANDYGSVFRLVPGGKPTVICRFTGSNGARPTGGLIRGNDGAFYGTTSAGGNTFSASDLGAGTIFRLTAHGTLTILHSFTHADGAGPAGALVQSPDGVLYGTTIHGGDFDGGTVFEVTPAGAFTSLQSFGDSHGWLVMQGGLVLGADGKLYGTTSAANLDHSPVGQLFRIDPAGGLTILREFPATDALLPVGAPTLGADGSIYGVLQGIEWGTSSPYYSSRGGSIYRVQPDGTISSVYSIQFEHRAIGSLVAAPDGSFYGCLDDGANGHWPQLYHFKPDGTDQSDERDFSYTKDFADNITGDYILPGEMTLASDGNLYGVFPGSRSDNKPFGGILRVPGVTALPTVYASGSFVTLPGNGTGKITLTLDRPATTDLKVFYKLGGSATAGVDYQPLSGHVKIKAGMTRKIIYISVRGNLGGAAQKILSLKLQPGNGYDLGNFGKSDLWISDSDNAPPGGGDGGATLTF